MNNLQIENMVKSHPCGRNFHGVYAADTLPDTPQRGKSYIVNCDESHKSGSHWVAFYKPPNNAYPDYFDSFGFPPLNEYFYTFLKDYRFFYYNNVTLQATSSNICGEYCIFYVIQRMRGLSTLDIISVFDANNAHFNDDFIKKYIDNTFDVDTKLHNSHYVENQIAKLYLPRYTVLWYGF